MKYQFEGNSDCFCHNGNYILQKNKNGLEILQVNEGKIDDKSWENCWRHLKDKCLRYKDTSEGNETIKQKCLKLNVY